MYPVFLLIEIAVCTAVLLPLALFAPPLAALLVSVALLLLVYFLRPAKKLDRHLRRERRRVIRRFHVPPVPAHITLRPQDHLTPAEVFRLMEILHAVPKDRLASADFTATLLDFNRRGLIALSPSDDADLLRADGMRISFQKNLNLKSLKKHEQCLVRLLLRAAGPASSVQLSAFYEYVSRAPGSAQRQTDAFRNAVDRSLREKKMLVYQRVGRHTLLHPFGRRVLLLTRRGEQSASLWRSYFRAVCTHPFLDSYRPSDADHTPFAAEALRLLVDAASCGYCAKAADALLREYLFDPMHLWPETQYFSSLTETRTAFSATEHGEDYFFLPLRDYENAVRLAVLHGTEAENAQNFEA